MDLHLTYYGYHFIFLYFGLFKINCILALVVIMLVSYFLAEKRIKNIVWALMYMLVFPFVYIIWGISLVSNLMKIKINNKRKVNKTIWIKNLKNWYKKPKNILKKEY